MNSREIKRLAANLQIKKSAIDHERILTDSEAALEKSVRPKIIQSPTLSKSRLSWLVWITGLAAAFLIISTLAVCFILTRKLVDLRNELEIVRHSVTATPVDETTTINFYLREHQDIVAQHASMSPATSQPLQMRVSQDDILYYEIFDEQPNFMRPGIIVRGPSSQRQISLAESPVISNGHTLTFSEARQAADFELVMPSWFNPCYILDQIRRIEDRDTLQLLYTDGINSVSLFEQPLDGQRGLEPQDFREYAVYRHQGKVGGTILAWRDNTLSYVLIGNIEMSQLMDMAQSINTRK